MNVFRPAYLKYLVVLAALIAAPQLCATPVTFATFTQKTNANAFQWNNNEQPGALRGGTFSATSVGVNFSFQGSVPIGLSGFQDATLTMVATSSTAATVIPIPPTFLTSFVIQPLAENAVGMITITRDNPFNGLTNLLTVMFFNATISGMTGSFSGNVDASTPSSPLPPAPLNVVFSSDFLDFSNTQARAFALSFASITPALGMNSNGMLRDFATAASGVFSAEPLPLLTHTPEPASMALIGGGLLAIGLIRFRSKVR
jgi:hypothetical protein